MQKATSPDDFLGLDPSMKGPFLASTLFHVLLLVITTVGLPFVVTDHMTISQPLSVEIVAIDKVTQTNRVAAPVKKPEETEKPPPKQEHEKPPQVTSETPPDLTQPKAPDIKDQKPAEKAEPVPVPKPQAKVEKPKQKPTPPKPDATKVEKPTQQNDFQSLLKNLTPDLAEESPNESDSTDPAAQSQIANLSDRLTMSEEDALRRQLSQCWNILAGAKYAEDLVVEVRLTVNRDRTLNQAVILDQGRYNRDSHFRAAADAALRALRNPRCSPLLLPPEKYEEWKTTIIRFDPREML